MSVRMRMRGHGEEAVVAFPLSPAFALAHLEHADQTGRHHAAGRHAVIEEQQHVERIAVFAQGRRHETEIVWKRQPLGEHGAEPQGPALAIVFVLVVAALGRLDDHGDVSRSRGREPADQSETGEDFFGRAMRQ